MNSSGSSDAGVGVGAVIAAVKGETKASIGGAANVKGTTITVSGNVPTANSTLQAKSGPTSDNQKASIGIAGALAIGVQNIKATAAIEPSANINVNNSNLTLIANSTTVSSVTAIPFQNSVDGTTLGLGASYALNVADRVTYAGLGNNAVLANTNNLSITATSNDTSTTRSKAGASGGIALAASVSNLITNQDTLADIGTGSLLTVSGTLNVAADHRSTFNTKAEGDVLATGSVAIGAAVSLAVINETTKASPNRSVTAAGNVSFTASSGSGSLNESLASTKGSSDNGGSPKAQADGQRTSADSQATFGGRGARGSGAKTTPQSSTSDGIVSIAAAITISLVNASSTAIIPASVTVTSTTGTATIRSRANHDSSTKADGKATKAGTVGVGTGVAVNDVDISNLAIIDTGATVSSRGLIVDASMLDIGGDTRHTFATESISGAGAKTVAIAGSLALALIDTTTQATVKAGATVSSLISSADISITASGSTSSLSKARPNDDGVTAETVGIGGSLALNRLNHAVVATIDNTAVITGSARNLNVAATANHGTTTESTAGGGDTNGLAGSVALAIIDNTTLASVGTGGAVTLTGTGDVRSTHTSTSATKSDATVTGSNVGIGVSVGINDDRESSSALLSRSLTLSGALNVLSTSSVVSTIDTKSTAKGADPLSGTADQTANKQRNQTPNTGSTSTLPSGNSAMSTGNGTANSNSSSRGSGLGIAASLGVNVLNASSIARIDSAAAINAGSSAIVVRASQLVNESTKAMGTSVALSDSTKIGASAGLSFATIVNSATVETGSIVRGGGITIEAITPAGQANSFVAWGAAAAGGTGGVGVAGSVAIDQINFTTLASAKSGSQLLSTGNVTVAANNSLNPQTLAAGAGFNAANNPVVGAAVALRIMTTQTDAFIGGSVDSAVALSITSRTTINPTVIDLPGPIADPTATSVAVAGSASTGGVGVAGAVVINIDSITTTATVGNGASVNQNTVAITGASNQSITITATDSITFTSLAGSLTIAPSSVGVGAGLDLEVVNKTTQAAIGRSTTVSSKSNVTVETTSADNFKTLAINAGIGNSAGIAGSASVYDVTSTSTALVDSASGQVSTLSSTGAVRIAATGNFTLTSLAGSVGAAGSAGVGASNVTLTHVDTVQASVGNNANITANGGSGLTVAASSSEDILGVSAAGAGGGSAAVAGSATVVVLTEVTQAWIGRLANVVAGNATTVGTQNVSVTSVDNTTLVSVAGSLAAAGTAAVGFGADVSKIAKTTTANIDSGVTATVKGNIIVTADSLEDITSVAAGLAAAGSASVAADAGVHVLDITTRAWIGDDGRDAVPTAGAGAVLANGSINVSADERTEIDKVVGVLAAAAYAGVGAAVGVSTSNKLTEAFIGNGAAVTALGGGAPLLVKTGEFNFGNVFSSVTTSGIEPGTASLTSSGSGLSGTGEVGLPKVGSMDVDRTGGNDATDTSITGQRTAVPKTRNANGLIVTATNRDDIEVYTISFAGGLGAVAITAGVNIVDNQTLATIGNGALINQTGVANAAQSVLVAAGSDLNQTAFGGTLAVGGAVAPAVGVTVIKENTAGIIAANAVVSARDDVNVQAFNNEDVLLAGAGIAGGFGLSAAVGVLTIDNQTTASIGSAARVWAGSDISVVSDDSSDIDIIAGAVAVGSAGIGAAVGVMTIDKATTALIDTNARVDAIGGGVATSQVLTGAKSADGNTLLRGNVSGVIVQATSLEDITHFTVAVGVGASVGVSGAVAVTILNSDTLARIAGGAKVNQTLDAAPSANESVFVNAANTVVAFAFAGALGVGSVGLSGAVNVGILRNDTLADVETGRSSLPKTMRRLTR